MAMVSDALVAMLGREILLSIDRIDLSAANNIASAVDELIQSRIADYMELMADRFEEKVKAARLTP